MNRPRILGRNKFYDYGILTRHEQKKFKNYHLPIFGCPSCGEVRVGTQLNMMGSSCVGCGYSLDLEEFQASSLKQFEKKEFAFKLDISKKEHQEIIALFRDNVLWQCSYCQRHNLNLPKGKDGEPDLSHSTPCNGCPNNYTEGVDLLPFWALKGFGFDDGDDSNNKYELRKLGETQLLWLQAIAKARKNDELYKLQTGLEQVKRNTSIMTGSRWKDGRKALRYIEGYLLGKGVANRKNIMRATGDYVRAVLDTNDTYSRTPVMDNANELQKYFYNLIHLHQGTLMGTGLGAVTGALLLGMIIETKTDIQLGEVFHTSGVQREDKGWKDKKYRISRREPKYFAGINYANIPDSAGEDEYLRYKRNPIYKLTDIGGPEEIKNGSKTFDTGRDEWVSTICPSTDTGTGIGGGSSFGGGGGSGSSGGGGMGFGGSGDLFHVPEEGFHPDVPVDNITEIERDWTMGTIVAELIGAPKAVASSCGYYRNITETATRYVTIQRYRIWDWDEKKWYYSNVIPGLDYSKTLEKLKAETVTDKNNQRIADTHLVMEIEIQNSDGEIEMIPVQDEKAWIRMSEQFGKSCSIEKPLLLKILHGINDDDIKSCIN